MISRRVLRAMSALSVLLALTVFGGLAARPTYAAATLTASLVGGNPLNANTTRTFRTVATNTTGATKTFVQYAEIGIGVFFPTTLPSGCVQHDPPLRKVECTYSLTNGATKTIDFDMWIGDGYFDTYNDKFWSTLYIDNAGGDIYQDDAEVWSTPLGSNFYNYDWDAGVGATYAYNNVSSDSDYIIMRADWSGNRTGRLVWRASYSSIMTISSMSMCESNSSGTCTSGSLGSWSYTDGTHQAAMIDYSSWGGNKYYKITANLSINGTDGQGGHAWQVFMWNNGSWNKALDSYQSWYLV